MGIETASSVTPNDANSRPTIVGLAPSRREKSGSTGTQIEYAMTSANVASVTRATVAARENRQDIQGQ